jgi:hypothetical protein
MLANRLGDTLAALEPGRQELVGVGPVDGRTGRAAGLQPGATGLQQYTVRLPATVVDGADLARLAVGLLDPSGQPDRVVAVAGLGDQLGPAVTAVPGPLDQLAEEQLPHPGRLGHATSPGAGMGGTARSPGAWAASNSPGSARSPELACTMAATWR